MAEGPLFKGCGDLGLVNCTSPPVKGPCHNYTAMWFYDVNYGGCSRFWYGGCDPGPNHFEDEASCLESCVSPPGPKACFLSKNSGSCQGIYNEWYFDIGKKTCSPFIHSGCLGNNNRFQSRSECQNMCTHQDQVPLCLKPKMEGSCEASLARWYFDENLLTCLPCKLTEKN